MRYVSSTLAIPYTVSTSMFVSSKMMRVLRSNRYGCWVLMVSFACGYALGQSKGGNPLMPAPLPQELMGAADLTDGYKIIPNVVYLTANNYEAKLDVYESSGSEAKQTLIYIHGGGWGGGYTKEQYSLWFEPFLLLGWNVVNVEYRPSSISLAPAAVEDCLCALRWVIQNSKNYNFDTSQLVLMGHSAGGHLALMTGMTPDSAGLDRECPGSESLKVAAIIDWFGITDVQEVIAGPNVRPWAEKWLGSLPDRNTLAIRVSPLTYVRSGLPPTIIIHGDKDPTVPYTQALRLRSALAKAGVPNQLVTIPGGGHGFFGKKQTQKAYAEIFDFLEKNGVPIRTAK
jgi:acetyl esterase/lipase